MLRPWRDNLGRGTRVRPSALSSAWPNWCVDLRRLLGRGRGSLADSLTHDGWLAIAECTSAFRRIADDVRSHRGGLPVFPCESAGSSSIVSFTDKRCSATPERGGGSAATGAGARPQLAAGRRSAVDRYRCHGDDRRARPRVDVGRDNYWPRRLRAGVCAGSAPPCRLGRDYENVLCELAARTSL